MCPARPVLARFRLRREHQRLFVAESVVDQFHPVVRAMVSEHVLVQQGEKIAFFHESVFHESFFDDVFARQFAAQGRQLVPFLCDGEQHLFRRVQVRQILLHEREVDRDYYLDALLSSFPDDTSPYEC